MNKENGHIALEDNYSKIGVRPLDHQPGDWGSGYYTILDFVNGKKNTKVMYDQHDGVTIPKERTVKHLKMLRGRWDHYGTLDENEIRHIKILKSIRNKHRKRIPFSSSEEVEIRLRNSIQENCVRSRRGTVGKGKAQPSSRLYKRHGKIQSRFPAWMERLAIYTAAVPGWDPSLIPQ